MALAAPSDTLRLASRSAIVAWDEFPMPCGWDRKDRLAYGCG